MDTNTVLQLIIGKERQGREKLHGGDEGAAEDP